MKTAAKKWLFAFLLGAFALFSQGCSKDDNADAADTSDLPGVSGEFLSGAYPTEKDIFKFLKTGDEQNEAFCARAGSDKVREVFCSDNPPEINSLTELREAMGLFLNPGSDNGQNGNAGFAITAHSSSLVAKDVSSINPRVVLFTPNVQPGDEGYVAMGFTRGEQLVEIAAHDPDTDEVKFFLLTFTQNCNDKDGGCSHGDLLLPLVEDDWKKLTIYEDVDLKNTSLDCLQCHQTQGPGTKRILRMQELRAPWTHWMSTTEEGGVALLRDFENAKGVNEDYGSIPASLIPRSSPALLEQFIINTGFEDDQDNLFDSATIEAEVKNFAPFQPFDNSFSGFSQTWMGIYDQFVGGAFIAPPYHDVKVTDPTKLAVMSESYQFAKLGLMPVDDLPDIRKVHKEEDAWAMGFAMKPGLTGEEILVQACAQCHNSNLDQSLSRAQFNVDLGSMTRAQKDKAIDRLKLPEDHLLKMPPSRFRTLTDEERDLLIEVLEQ